jgi:hypothetical protein
VAKKPGFTFIIVLNAAFMSMKNAGEGILPKLTGNSLCFSPILVD